MEDRFSLVLKAKNITASRLADDIKVQRSAISHILSGRNKPSLDLLQKIFETYPDISPDWLINGKGPMFRGSQDLFSMYPEPTQSVNSRPSLVKEKEVKHDESHENESSRTLTPAKDEQKITISEKPSPEVTRKEARDNEIDKALISKALSKDVERIVIFYKDRTFIEYKPE